MTMVLPPLLEQHIQQLKEKYTIEIQEKEEIYIIFKNYEIPSSIWTLQKTDLLIITHNVYPNAKIDMFWVDPPIELKNGKKAKAVIFEEKCGKRWQRFSWHVEKWNPARDNLATYLDDVNERLRREDAE